MKMQKWAAKKELITGSFLGLVMLLLAFSGWYFVNVPAFSTLDQTTLNNSIDLRVSNVVIKKFDNKGQLVHFMEAPYIKHKPYQDTHVISSPHIVINQTNKAPVEIRSKEATSTFAGNTIRFYKEVTIHQGRSHSADESLFKTEELLYYPKTKYAVSNKPITYSQAETEIKSQGMRAYLGDNQHSALLLKARARYEPNHS